MNNVVIVSWRVSLTYQVWECARIKKINLIASFISFLSENMQYVWLDSSFKAVKQNVIYFFHLFIDSITHS